LKSFVEGEGRGAGVGEEGGEGESCWRDFVRRRKSTIWVSVDFLLSLHKVRPSVSNKVRNRSERDEPKTDQVRSHRSLRTDSVKGQSSSWRA